MFRKKKRAKKRKWLFMLACFMFMGVVYASVARTLVFEGEVTLLDEPPDEIALAIIDTASTAGGSITVTHDEQVATINIGGASAGTELEFVFKIANKGEVPAYISLVTLDNPTSHGVYHNVDYARGSSLSPQEVLGEYLVILTLGGHSAESIDLIIEYGITESTGTEDPPENRQLMIRFVADD